MKKKKRSRSHARTAKPGRVRGPAVAEEATADTAKLFWNGRSQAVRLPREFRFDGDEVLIRRSGDSVILDPVRTRRGWPAGFWERLGKLGDDFERAVADASQRVESPPPDLETL